MFAGPNGSGKSTLKTVLRPDLLGIYLNPDDIEKDIRDTGFLNLPAYGAEPTAAEANCAWEFFRKSQFLAHVGLGDMAERLKPADDGRLLFDEGSVNSYFASVAADFLRGRLLEGRVSFTCETVMSSPDKVALLAQAQRLGFRTYLYFVATEDPAINVARVRHRVRVGGHPVPEDKIVSRYARSLALLMEAVRHTNRAYIFDNSESGRPHVLLAEITDGHTLTMKTGNVPAWFRRTVQDKIIPPPAS